MPNLDKKGPLGQGPATGWGRGQCGYGFRRGCGRGFGQGFGRRFWSDKNELESLEAEEKMLEEELKALKAEKQAIKSNK